MKLRHALFAATVFASIAMATGSANAAPAPLAATTVRDIAVARTNDPNSFLAVRSIISQARELDAKARGGKAPVASYLAKLGSKAVLPMIEMMNDGTAAPARRDVIEALGLLRDPRALPLLENVLDEEGDDATTRAAAEAVARYGNDEAMTRIEGALARSKSASRTNAILAGIGECRRVRMANVLARHATKGDAKVVARSFGRIGNAWAWKTVADKSEEAAVREIAARNLVAMFVRGDDEARNAASNALMVVDDPHTNALIAEAKKGASPELASALDALAARFAQNPAR